MISVKRPNGLGLLIFLFALISIFHGFTAPRVSAEIISDFDEAVEILTEGLLSKKKKLLGGKRIAVYGIIEGKSKKKWEISPHIEDGVVDVLVNKGYTVIERRRIDDVVKEEIKKSTDWWFDKTQVAQFGKLVGADVVVTGTYVLWGPSLLKIAIRAIDVTRGGVLASNKVKVLRDGITAFLKIEAPGFFGAQRTNKPGKKRYSANLSKSSASNTEKLITATFQDDFEVGLTKWKIENYSGYNNLMKWHISTNESNTGKASLSLGNADNDKKDNDDKVLITTKQSYVLKSHSTLKFKMKKSYGINLKILLIGGDPGLVKEVGFYPGNAVWREWKTVSLPLSEFADKGKYGICFEAWASGKLYIDNLELLHF